MLIQKEVLVKHSVFSAPMLRYILITVNAVAMDIYCLLKKKNPVQPEYQVEKEYMNFVGIRDRDERQMNGLIQR